MVKEFKDVLTQGKQVTTMIKASRICLFLALAAVCVGGVIGSCILPPHAGNCDGICPRWYNDVRVGSCRPFTYGCCGGNGNNFITRELCENVCRDPENNPDLICGVFCFVDPCDTPCPNFPQATCFRLCGCRAIWIYNGEDVTRRCRN
ncbi:doenitin-1-like [Crassostrea virginica]